MKEMNEWMVHVLMVNPNEGNEWMNEWFMYWWLTLMKEMNEWMVHVLMVNPNEGNEWMNGSCIDG
jgi:hypothetical protein